MDALKPCPFCGNEAEKWFEVDNSIGGPWAQATVYCKKCDAKIVKRTEVRFDSMANPGLAFMDAEKKAADMWNSRDARALSPEKPFEYRDLDKLFMLYQKKHKDEEKLARNEVKLIENFLYCILYEDEKPKYRIIESSK